MADLGVWTVDGDGPQRVSRSGVDLEKNLEDWIAADSSLLADGLAVVGRQLRLDGGPLDLLAIDWQNRWVVIELKRRRLYRDSLAQALDYASSIAQMDGDELASLLQPGLGSLGDAEELSQAVRRQLSGEEEGREVAVLLAGIGVDPRLERVVDYLGGYEVPITIVNFEVFQPEDGPLLLIREVTEEQTGTAPRQNSWRTLDEMLQFATAEGVGAQFERLVRIAEEAGLVVRAYKYAVSLVPRQNRTRVLVYAAPTVGGIYFEVNRKAFTEFFPPVTEDDLVAALGTDIHRRFLWREDLDARLDQIEAFLKTLPRQGEDE